MYNGAQQFLFQMRAEPPHEMQDAASGGNILEAPVPGEQPCTLLSFLDHQAVSPIDCGQKRWYLEDLKKSLAYSRIRASQTLCPQYFVLSQF